MRPWRKVLEKEWQPTVWALHLECGHVAFRSARYAHPELPDRVPCEACKSLIGSQVKNPLGKVGTVAGYSDGAFAIAWTNEDLSHLTLDELREAAEIL